MQSNSCLPARVDHFMLLERLHIGSDGSGVYRGIRENTQLEFAIKVVPKRDLEKPLKSRVQKEMEELKKLQHFLIVKLYRVFEDLQNIYLVMEYCENGTLADYFKKNAPVSEAEMRKFFVQILTAIEFAHSNGICHSNINGDNVLLDSNFNIRLTGFGRSHPVSSLYASPEYFKFHTADASADIWALGVLIYLGATGRFPFEEESDKKIMMKTLFTSPQLNENISFPLANVITLMLAKEPEERANISVLKKHPFFSPMELNAISPGVSYNPDLLSKSEEVSGVSPKQSLLTGVLDDSTTVYHAMKRDVANKEFNTRKRIRRETARNSSCSLLDRRNRPNRAGSMNITATLSSSRLFE